MKCKSKAKIKMSKLSKEVRNESYKALKDKTEKQKALLYVLSWNKKGMTDKELARSLGWDLSAVNSTRNRLVLADLVTDSKTKENPKTGKQNTVWVLV